jgi:predicted thioesterase
MSVTVGLKNEIKHKFQGNTEYCATKLQTGNTNIVSTSTILSFLSKSAYECVRNFIPEGKIPVVSRAQITILYAFGIDEEIVFLSEVKGADSNSIHFNIRAHNDVQVYGAPGELDIELVDKDEFAKRLL